MTKDKKEILNRFTTLPVLIDLLRRKKLVLLSPENWEDRNDAEIMLEYKKRKELKQLYAVCFSEGEETIHHWTAFSSGSSGCCIEFDKELLLADVHKVYGITTRSVTYKKINELKAGSINTPDIPFTKRWPYRCEEEYRIVYESNDSPEKNKDQFDIEINLKSIRRITFNQRMPDQVYQTIKEYLKDEFEDPEKRIHKSTLYENKKWISRFKKK